MKSLTSWLLATCLLLSAGTWAEGAKPFIQEAEPSTGVEVGSFWYKESTGILYQATSITPVTFAIYASADATTQLRKLLYPKATEYTADYFPAPTSTQPGAVPPTGTPSGKFLKDDGTWAAPSSGGVPAGLITFVVTGTCPAGWTEVSALAGKTLFGTVAANADVGTTGGADSIIPTVNSLTAAAQTVNSLSAAAQTISWPAGVPTFAGAPFSGIINHTHPITDPGHTHVITELRDATTGGASTNIALTADTSSTLGTKVTGSRTTGITTANPAGGVASITPAGTVAWPAGVPTTATSAVTGTMNTSAVTGTLNGFDNRSAFTKVIFCSAN